MMFDPDALLAALPVRPIQPPPLGTPRPRLRWSSSGASYNGFTPDQRYRTEALAKWLQAINCMAPPDACSICGEPARHHHAEDHFAFERWVAICVACHKGLHKRFQQPGGWHRCLERLDIAQGHWARLISSKPFDLAALLMVRARLSQN